MRTNQQLVAEQTAHLRIDQKSLIEAIARLAQLAGDFPQIKELDINPLLLTAQGVKVLDARIVIE